MISWILFGIITCVSIYLFIGSRKKLAKSLPGPKGLPLIGNLLQLNKFQHISFGQWAKEYGPIYKIKLANQTMVVVSDYKMVKEMFSQSVFSGRMDLRLFDYPFDGKQHGIINTEGPHWEELRHFTLRQLRDFGFGKNSMEESIMLEVNELIQTLVAHKERPVTDIKDRFMLAVVNALWFIATGHRHKQNDPQLTGLTHKVHAMFAEILENGALLLFAPWVAEWFPRLSGYTKIKAMLQEFVKVFAEPVQEHIETYSDNYQRDFIDAYLKEAKATTDQKSAFFGKLGVHNLTSILGDLYFAGSDTTSTTIAWMMIYLTKAPGIQEKLQAEIELITGNTRPCSVADRPNMPFTEAVIAETLRYSTIVPAGVGHKALFDTEFKGYTILKDTLITSNLHYIHYDPAIWGDPQNFRPERFLNPDGQSFKKHEALIPFSIGRRQCLGETLARDSLFLFTTNIFQRFCIEFDHNGPENGLESELAFVLTPKPFHLIFKDRHN